jgi:hypothetical protein
MSGPPWVLLLYALPKGRSTARVGLWRKLKKTGALSFKTSAYLLPNWPELVERFQWIAQQVIDGGGESSVVFVAELNGVSHDDIVRQFNAARDADYAELLPELKPLVSRKASSSPEKRDAELEKAKRRFEEIRNIDYFAASKQHDVEALLSRAAHVDRPTPSASLSREDFGGKVWLTRPRPAIDRVGSAWLIQRFIDPEASFVFSNDPAEHPKAIPYDMMGVEFTHQNDDCTFETLLKRFGLDALPLRKIGEMVHEADLEDGKFQAQEAIGLNRVFNGWAKLGVPDHDILERGFLCFDALHAYLDSKP